MYLIYTPQVCFKYEISILKVYSNLIPKGKIKSCKEFQRISTKALQCTSNILILLQITPTLSILQVV